ncbi:hypothetical protein HY312_04220 [Candidatus Saccharibacteria bacterium]|nr:hypothetical protein [Candidatus Saccharibacteria bacterium]
MKSLFDLSPTEGNLVNKVIFTSYNIACMIVNAVSLAISYVIAQYITYTSAVNEVNAARQATTYSVPPNADGYMIDGDLVIDQNSGVSIPLPHHPTFFEVPINWTTWLMIAAPMLAAFGSGILVHCAFAHEQKKSGSTSELAYT